MLLRKSTVFAPPCLIVSQIATAGDRKDGLPESSAQVCVAAPTPDCLFRLAVDAARKHDSENQRDNALAEIVESEAAVSRLDLARMTLGEIVETGPRARASAAIAIGAAKSGDFGTALTIASMLDNRLSERDALYARIAAIQKLTGDIAAANQTVSLIETETWRRDAIDRLARITQAQPEIAPMHTPQMRRGQAATEALVHNAPTLVDALSAARKRKDRDEKAEALSLIALLYARAGDRKVALRVARSIEEPAYSCFKTCDARRDASIWQIAAIQVDLRDRSGALEVADSLDANSRNVALAYIVEAQLRNDRLSDAIDTALLIRRADLRTTAFRKIAVAFAEHSR